MNYINIYFVCYEILVALISILTYYYKDVDLEEKNEAV